MGAGCVDSTSPGGGDVALRSMAFVALDVFLLGAGMLYLAGIAFMVSRGSLLHMMIE